MLNQNLPLASEGHATFVNTRLPYTTVDGVYYVALKPLCDDIGIDYKTAFQGVKNDEILSQLYRLAYTVGEDGKRREMLCLPWQFVHGWVFSINLSRVKPEAKAILIQYKLKGYEALHNFFVGSAEHMTKRKAIYMELMQMKREISDIEGKLSDNKDFQSLVTLRKAYAKKKREFDALDEDEFGVQLSLLD